MMLSRRELCERLLCGACAVGLTTRRIRAAAPQFQVDRLLSESPVQSVSPRTRTYRADAFVTILGLPIFSRRGVGSAFVEIREALDGDRRLIALDFAGGSNPERTHGLEFSGSTEEVVMETPSGPVQAASFGFVTRTRTESYEDARQHFAAKTLTSKAYTALEGRHSPGCARYDRANLILPIQDRRDIEELVQQVRSQFSTADRTTNELSVSSSSAAATFLYSVLGAIRSGKRRSSYTYVHNAREYRLEWERTPDLHAGRVLTAKGLTDHPESVTRLIGHIRERSADHASTFQLWLDDTSELPLRIEFQPRSYLRITLEWPGSST
jgi:hypothetical protein